MDRKPHTLAGHQMSALHSLARQAGHLLELRRAHAAVQAAEIRYRRLFETSPAPMWVIDRTSLAFLAVNDAAVADYGYSREEFLQLTVKDLRPAEDVPALLAHVAATFGQTPGTGHWRHRRRDGSVFPVRVFSHDIEFDQRPARLAIGIDESTEQDAKCALEASESRFRALSECAPIGIFETDPAGRCSYANPAMEEIVGRPETALRQLGWLRTVHPRDRTFLRDHCAQAIGAGGSWGGEVRLVTPDHSIRWVRSMVAPQKDPAGRVCAVVGTIEDITASRLAEVALLESEERFKLAARAGSDVIWDADLIRHRVWLSDSYEQVFGRAPNGARPSNQDWEDRLHTDDRARVLASLERTIAGRAASWSEEYRFLLSDGSYAHVQDRAQIMRDEHGRALRMLGGMTDRTEHKKLEAQYLRAQRMESIGTLAGGIAHDLNNVLTPILMSINLLKPAVRHDSGALDILRTVETSTRRGADLVRQVLSFARGFGGNRATVNLRHLIDEIVRIAGETFPRTLKLRTECPRHLWLVSGDATQLHQVLMNLTVNARDAMPAGGTLTLSAANLVIDDQYASASRDAKPGSYVLLQVADTGQGIAPAHLDHIFEPFFTTKEVGQGTGLGLSTVHAIVKGHGGFVTVCSEPARGTTFKVYLPADPLLNAGVGPAASPDLPRGRGECLLLVEDEASIRHIAQQTLESCGYRVITAVNGADAVALFAQHQTAVALVITDMLMPVMDGPATIHALLHLRPALRIIAASGLSANGSITKAAHAGVKDFLPKPYTSESLLRLIREVLDRP